MAARVSRDGGGVDQSVPPRSGPPPAPRTPKVLNAIHFAEQSARNCDAAAAQLADAQRRKVQAMVRCRAVGMSFTEIAEIFGVTRGYVSNVVAGRQGK